MLQVVRYTKHFPRTAVLWGRWLPEPVAQMIPSCHGNAYTRNCSVCVHARASVLWRTRMGNVSRPKERWGKAWRCRLQKENVRNRQYCRLWIGGGKRSQTHRVVSGSQSSDGPEKQKLWQTGTWQLCWDYMQRVRKKWEVGKAEGKKIPWKDGRWTQVAQDRVQWWRALNRGVMLPQLWHYWSVIQTPSDCLIIFRRFSKLYRI